MIPITTNDLHNFAKYKVIRTVRQLDGATLIATRVVTDIKLPVRWDVEYNDPKPFKALVLNSEGPYSTSELIKKAREAGFGDWYPIPEEMVEIFPIDAAGDDSKRMLAPKYPEPDTTDYLVD
jgi:hypothetical protein